MNVYCVKKEKEPTIEEVVINCGLDYEEDKESIIIEKFNIKEIITIK